MTAQFCVVIPSYNRLPLLKEAVESIRRQTLKAKKIVVVDDGSTDDTVAWCSSQNDLHFIQTQRMGPSGARNKGAEICDCEWIAFLDSDDVWSEEHLETAYSLINSIDHCEAIVCNFTLTDAKLDPQKGLQGFIGGFPAFRSSEKLLRALFPVSHLTSQWHGDARKQALYGNWLQPSGLVIRKSLFQSLNGFNPKLWRCEDMDLLLRLVTLAPVTLSLKPTYRWRQQQPESLAADKFTLELKRTGAKIMTTRGLKIVQTNPRLFLLWCASVVWMLIDLSISTLLRVIRRWESSPLPQTIIQGGLTLLNIAVPILLGRQLSRGDFAQYRTFALYLSSVTALSLTSGLWSLIPFWISKQKDGHKFIATAWWTLCISSFAISIVLMVVSPIKSYPNNWQLNSSLALASAFLIPGVFLEQRLTALRRGLLASVFVSFTEVSKCALLLTLAFLNQSLVVLMAIIPVFLLLRATTLFLITKKVSPLQIYQPHITEVWSIMRATFPLGLSSALLGLSAIADRLFLLNRLSSAEFAVIAAGTLSFPLASLLEQNTVQHSLHKLATLTQSKRLNECAIIIRTNIETISKFTVPFCMATSVFAPEILDVLFAKKYQDATPVLRIFSLSYLQNCIPPDALSRAQGWSKRILYFAVVSVFLTTLCLWVGFSYGGILGGIAGSVLGGLSARIIYLYSDLQRNQISLLAIAPQRSCFVFIATQSAIILLLKTCLLATKAPAFICFVLLGFYLVELIRQTLFSTHNQLIRFKEL